MIEPEEIPKVASYGNRTHVNSLEGCYATTTPTMQILKTNNNCWIDLFPMILNLSDINCIESDTVNEKITAINWRYLNHKNF